MKWPPRLSGRGGAHGAPSVCGGCSDLGREGFLQERALEQGSEAWGRIAEWRYPRARRLSKLTAPVLETLRFCDWTQGTRYVILTQYFVVLRLC